MKRENYWLRNKNTPYDRETLLMLWERYSLLMEQDQTSSVIDEENELLELIESKMLFKDKKEHEEWLEMLEIYKCWEDFEELTLSILNRIGQEEKDKLIFALERVAKHLAYESSMITLFDAFEKLSNGWVKKISEWKIYWQELCQDEWELQCFLDAYKEIYDKDVFNSKDLVKFYGFETSPSCMFFYDNTDSKYDLLECIFERYAMGLEDDECIEFFKALIKELL